MSLRQTITDEMKKAMLAKNESRLKTIRLMQAALKDKDIAGRTADSKDGITDDAIIKMLQSMVKQRRDSIAMYEQGGRPELAKAEQTEIHIIKEFLPQMMEGAELEKAIKDAIATTGAATIKDMGKVMNHLKEKFPGKIDAAQAGAMVKTLVG
ncbi:MAG: GatB/YqeY domain-containing protein [Hydrotalea sp.]|nr:GatB/YqeY domain-containing protein [Hydrotalea sp.]